jgi:hypothetical protein
MGSVIEINDTLKLTRDEGLPATPKLGEVYAFTKSERRLYHLKPTRVFLVEEKQGLWNFIGHAEILELTMDAEKDQTRGRFVITQIYERDYALMLNKREAPAGKGFVPEG